MFIRERWSNRTPGTGRLILLVGVFGSLFVYLVWAAFVAPDESLPHPVAAEFRLVSVDGKPLPAWRRCFGRKVGGRMLLGEDGRWWMEEVDCKVRYGLRMDAGNYRWSGDTLVIHRPGARPGEFPRRFLVLRGDTIDVIRRREGKKSVSRFVRVRTPGPASTPAQGGRKHIVRPRPGRALKQPGVAAGTRIAPDHPSTIRSR